MKDSTEVSIIFFITLIVGMISLVLLLLYTNMSTSECEKVVENKENCFLWNGSKCVYKCNKKILLIYGFVSLIIFISLLLYLRYITSSTNNLSKKGVLKVLSNFINKITKSSKKND
jgi:uncharacterized membrane protein